jgi:hypothetical protein
MAGLDADAAEKLNLERAVKQDATLEAARQEMLGGCAQERPAHAFANSQGDNDEDKQNP